MFVQASFPSEIPIQIGNLMICATLKFENTSAIYNEHVIWSWADVIPEAIIGLAILHQWFAIWNFKTGWPFMLHPLDWSYSMEFLCASANGFLVIMTLEYAEWTMLLGCTEVACVRDFLLSTLFYTLPICLRLHYMWCKGLWQQCSAQHATLLQIFSPPTLIHRCSVRHQV